MLTDYTKQCGKYGLDGVTLLKYLLCLYYVLYDWSYVMFRSHLTISSTSELLQYKLPPFQVRKNIVLRSRKCMASRLGTIHCLCA